MLWRFLDSFLLFTLIRSLALISLPNDDLDVFTTLFRIGLLDLINNLFDVSDVRAKGLLVFLGFRVSGVVLVDCGEFGSYAICLVILNFGGSEALFLHALNVQFALD